MSNLPVVGLYAALNTLVLLWLTFATGAARRRCGVLVGDGGDARLMRVMRGHANAVENIPMMFVLMIIAAGIGTPAFVLHALGAVFTAGRVLHARHFTQEDAPAWQRSAGFGLGLLAMVLLALGVLGHGIWQLVHA